MAATDEAVNRSMNRAPSIFSTAMDIWDKWSIQTLVLCSFFLQIILIMFGRKRKYISRILLHAIIWLFYVFADWVATLALSSLARKEEDADKLVPPSHNTIQAFWAPFLLLHLGGPDTITSYALEDNKLWSRHLLGLAVQVAVAIYAYFGASARNVLTFAAIPVFVSGLIKYGERTWALKSSTTKHIKNSLVKSATHHHVKNNSNKDTKMVVPRPTCPKPSTHYLHRAHYLFKMSSYLFSDLILGISELRDSYSIISCVKSPKEAFQLVEVELGLIYDRLYTKAHIVQSWEGLILRCFSFLSLFTALVLFSIISFSEKFPHFSGVDIRITYTLLVGGLTLEVFAFANLILSDWTMIWLVQKSGNPPSNSVCRFIFSLHEYFNKSTRWSGSMAQYNLIHCCLRKESEYINKWFNWDIDWKDVNGVTDLKESIFRHLLKRSKQIIKKMNVNDEEEPITVVQSDSSTNDNETKVPIRELQDDDDDEGQSASSPEFFVYQKCAKISLAEKKFWIEKTASLNHNIIIWHIATDLCYHSDLENSERSAINPNYEISKALSEYMLYLLIKKPKLLPRAERSAVKNEYKQVRSRIHSVLKGKCKKSFSYLHKEACNKLLMEEEDCKKEDDDGDDDKCLLRVVVALAKELNNKEFEEKWKVISKIWMEIVSYAANNYEWRYHSQELTNGGEFITHITLLMAHLGLSEQFQEFDVGVPDRLRHIV